MRYHYFLAFTAIFLSEYSLAHENDTLECEDIDYRLSTKIILKHGPINSAKFRELTCTQLRKPNLNHPKNESITDHLEIDNIILTNGRYERIKPQAHYFQRFPLQKTYNGQIPRTYRNIGEAIDFILNKSGYRIASHKRHEFDEMYVLFLYPVPDVQRSFKNIQISEILQTLAGKAFDVYVDDVNREIGFKLSKKYLNALDNEKINKAKRIWLTNFKDKNNGKKSKSTINNESRGTGLKTYKGTHGK